MLLIVEYSFFTDLNLNFNSHGKKFTELIIEFIIVFFPTALPSFPPPPPLTIFNTLIKWDD